MSAFKALPIDPKHALRACQVLHPAGALFILLLVGVLLGITDVQPAQAATKAEELQQRLADISLLHGQLQEKIDSAVDIREALYDEVKQLRSEVMTLKKEKRIKTLAEGVDLPRIRYNLTLIRELKGYIANFNDKIRFLQIGSDKLYYLYHQAEDDLRIIHTLNDLKVDALQSQINAVMDEYLPEAHNLLIDLNRIPYEKPEHIWKQLLRGSL